MRITLILVTSVNGKLTDGKSMNVRAWTSHEDQQYFSLMIRKHTLIIMGRKTYEEAKDFMKLVADKLRMVMTGNPERYRASTISGQLEFTQESPAELVRRLEKAGYHEGLLVGGSEISAKFIQSGLVDNLSLTIEPYLFGNGIQFFSQSEANKRLRLVSVNKLNEQGTLLLTYAMLK